MRPGQADLPTKPILLLVANTLTELEGVEVRRRVKAKMDQRGRLLWRSIMAILKLPHSQESLLIATACVSTGVLRDRQPFPLAPFSCSDDASCRHPLACFVANL